MRDFFIKALEMVINVVVVLAALAIIGVSVGVMVGGIGNQLGLPDAVAGLLVLLGGALYLILIAGFMYMGLGIYQNTKKTAALLEQLASR